MEKTEGGGEGFRLPGRLMMTMKKANYHHYIGRKLLIERPTITRTISDFLFFFFKEKL